MLVDAIVLSPPWLLSSVLLALFLLCLVFFIRNPRRFHTLIPCVALGAGLTVGGADDIRFDGKGVTQAGFRESRTLAWRDIVNVQIDARHTHSGEVDDLRFVDRSGNAIVVPGASQLGRRDAVLIGEFVKSRLPGALGFKVRARLPALQSRDDDWQYHVAVSPGA